MSVEWIGKWGQWRSGTTSGKTIINGHYLSPGNLNDLGGVGLGPAVDAGLTAAGFEARQTLGEILRSLVL